MSTFDFAELADILRLMTLLLSISVDRSSILAKGQNSLATLLLCTLL